VLREEIPVLTLLKPLLRLLIPVEVEVLSEETTVLRLVTRLFVVLNRMLKFPLMPSATKLRGS
jgi:hypothetical protein